MTNIDALKRAFWRTMTFAKQDSLNIVTILSFLGFSNESIMKIMEAVYKAVKSNDFIPGNGIINVGPIIPTHPYHEGLEYYITPVVPKKHPSEAWRGRDDISFMQSKKKVNIPFNSNEGAGLVVWEIVDD